MQEAISLDGRTNDEQIVERSESEQTKGLSEHLRTVQWCLKYVHTATERIIDRLKNLTGHFVLSGPFNTFALFASNFDQHQRLGV